MTRIQYGDYKRHNAKEITKEKKNKVILKE